MILEKTSYILIAVILIVISLQIGISFEEPEDFEANTMYVTPIDFSQELQESLDLVAERIQEDLKDDGSFHYIYYPSSKSYSDSYNIIRHTLGSYTLLELYKYYNDETYLEDAKKSIDYTMEYLVENDDMLYITYNDKTKVGTAAITILTLLNYEEITGETTYDETIEGLAEFILFMQEEDGGFQNYYPENDPEDKLSTVLYTGEADLALTRLYKKTGEEKYLEAVEKSYEWVKNYFDERHSTGLVSWASSAFAEVYYELKDPKYADLAFEMTDWLIDNTQYTSENAPEESYIGAFLINNTEDRLTCTVAAYSESINDMIVLAKNIGDPEHEKKYTKSLKASLEYMLSMQYTTENTTDENALGGFQASMYEDHFRIDFNTHAAISILKALENSIY